MAFPDTRGADGGKFFGKKKKKKFKKKKKKKKKKRCTHAVGIPVMGAWEAASHGAAQYGYGRPQMAPGKGGRCPSGQGNVDSWEVKMQGGSITRWTWKQQREGAEGGGGKCAVSRFDRAAPQEKSCTGSSA